MKSLTDSEIEQIDLLMIEKDILIDRWLYHNCRKAEKTEGYVYLIKCANAYKIGYSKDVERRIKQLDTRPFPLKLITKVYSRIALPVEQKIHDVLSDWCITGEWYSFDKEISPSKFEDYVDFIEEKITRL